MNDVPTPAGATVFDGDRVSADSQGLATISLGAGSRVLVTDRSAALLYRAGEETQVHIENGTVAIVDRGEDPVVVHALGLLIRPTAAAPTSYAARIEERAVVLTSVTGDVRVVGLRSSHTVPAGKSMRFELADPQGPAGAGAGAGPSLVLKAILVSAIVAAIVVPVVLHNTGDAVSP